MFQRTRNYAKDYEKIGSTIRYKGKHFRFNMEQPALNWRKAAFLLLLLIALALFVLIGFSDSPALGAGGHASAIYVILPYALLLLPLGLGFARALLLAVKTVPLEYAEYDKYMVQQKPTLLAALGLSLVLLAGELAFLLFGGASPSVQWVPTVETTLCAACIFAAFRQYHALFESIAIDEVTSVRYDI
jgi:hypothetical protein